MGYSTPLKSNISPEPKKTMENNPSFWEDKFSRVMLKIWEWQDSHIVIVEARQPKMKLYLEAN